MITIRKAGADEVHDIQVLDHEIFTDNSRYDTDLDLTWSLSQKGKEHVLKILNNPKGVCLIAEEDGKKIGILAAQPKVIPYRKSSYAEIDFLGVSPGYRSRGVGTDLIRAFLSWARETGFQRVYVNAYFKNNDALRFYRKNGFKEIDVSLEQDVLTTPVGIY